MSMGKGVSMAEGVTITIDMTIRPDMAEQVIAAIPAMFEDTARFPGFRSIRVVRHKDAANRLLIVERWDREEDYRAYQEWRNRDGAMDAAHQALEAYDMQVWAAEVGEAVA